MKLLPAYAKKFQFENEIFMTSDPPIVLISFLYFLPSLFLVAGLFDVLTGRIPDWISIVLVIGFLVVAAFAGHSWNAFGKHIGVALLVFLGGFAAFTMGWIGGGDGKLAAAGALWLGPSEVAGFLFLSSLYGTALVAIAYGLRHAVLPAFLLKQQWLAYWLGGNVGVPFGLAMAASILTWRQWALSLPTFFTG